MLNAARPSFALPTPAELSEYDAAFEATRDAPDALSGARAKDTWLMEYGLAPATLGADALVGLDAHLLVLRPAAVHRLVRTSRLRECRLGQRQQLGRLHAGAPASLGRARSEPVALDGGW